MAATPSSTDPIVLRAPSTIAIAQRPAFTPPPLDWLQGTWHVTHSTLPMWESKRNVSITYNSQAQTSPQRIDDVVSYQALSSDKTKTLVGVDTMNGDAGSWDWRGKGWLMAITSHWEVLGYGDLQEDHQWTVTYFAKTMFTPAGVDVYSRKKEGLSTEMIQRIKDALEAIEDDGVKKLGRTMFEVKRD